ncbi:50S ribosomal protein L11 methyltransferase [Enterobacter hormaechei]
MNITVPPGRFRVIGLPDAQPDAMKADVVVANILAGPLRELAPVSSTHLRAHETLGGMSNTRLCRFIL